MLIHQILTHLGEVLAAPAPAPSPTAPVGSGIVNTDGIVKTFATVIAPIIIAAIGIGILMRASRGQVSQSLTSTFIVVLGLCLMASAGALFLVGDKIVNLVFG